MSNITTDSRREIISDFANSIQNRLKRNAKPSKAVIEFRNERKENYERGNCSGSSRNTAF